MSFLVDEHVLRLEVAVDHPALVKILNGKDHLCRIEASPFLVETAPHLLQVKEELTAIDELHDKIQSLRVLEGILESHDEWMVKLLEDFPFNYK